MQVVVAIFTFTIFVIFSVAHSLVTTQNVQAIAADLFVESIGVNTHWTTPNVYTFNYTGIKAKLAESGIRYIRDICSTAVRARMKDLYPDVGIKVNMILETRKSGSGVQPLNITALPDALNVTKSEVLSTVVSFEAPNEYDLSHGPNDTDWVGNIKNYSILISTIVKSDELLRHIPIIGPSLTSANAYEAVGNMDPYIDYTNLHLYEWYYWPGNEGWDGKGAIPSITYYLNSYARQQSPSGKLVQVTETGYHDDFQTRGLSEIADGKYAIRAFAEFFRRGVYRTFKYELVNQGKPGSEGAYGLLHNDLSEKPSFRALKNIISVLSDKGSSFQPDTLNYILNGSLDNVRQILFQKRNGDFYLMIWTEVSCWNYTTLVDIYPPPQEIILTFQDSINISKVILYALNNTGGMNTSDLPISNHQVIFNATDTISIIQLYTNNFSSLDKNSIQLIRSLY